MGEVPPLAKLHRKYQPEHFQFFIVYSREAHPGENYPHHVSAEQKLAHAQKLRELEQIREIPILVDDFSGATHRAYGSLPNMVYLIDRDGVVVYKSDWSDANEIDGVCASLVRREELKANKVPILRQGISQRLHWIPMDPVDRERIYRRSGEKAIQDYFHARGSLPYATDAEKENKPRRTRWLTCGMNSCESAPSGMPDTNSEDHGGSPSFSLSGFQPQTFSGLNDAL